ERRSVARNWLKAAAGGTGRSVARFMVPFTRGSTTMLRPVIAAIVRATASISALTKLSVTGSVARWACSAPGAAASSSAAAREAAARRKVMGAKLVEGDERARPPAAPEQVEQ